MPGPLDPSEGGGGSAPPGGAEPPARARKSKVDRPKRRKNRRVTKRPAPPGGRPKRHKLRRPVPHRRESRRHLLFAAGGVLAVVATALLLLIFGYARLKGPGTTSVEIDWPGALDPEDAATLLAENGLVSSAATMALYLRTTGGTADFVPGWHVLPRDASPHELREMLSRSPSRRPARVVIPEGMHRFDIADRLQKQAIAGRQAFLSATADRALLRELGVDTTASMPAPPPQNQERTTDPPESAEGYLFPATYDFLVDTDPRDVVRRMVAESDRRWSDLLARKPQALATARTSLGWGRRELVTLASIIQREAMMDDERPIIASVFYNRLLDPAFKPRRRLQSDPTAMYGCVAHPEEAPSCADYRGKATSAILHDPKNRYSTYMAPGLPPGPISNPGLASLEAALAPASTRYFFFVAKGGGRHAFSETFGAHNDAIRARPQ
ncbi:MAG: endolytic transglycosylase MltG [Polyangiaceae bacterium]